MDHSGLGGPLEKYHLMLTRGEIRSDASQQQAISYLNEIWEKIEYHSHATSLTQIKGLYMWGSVGTGKTWMMDLFYHSVASKRKMRIHFHHFLKNIHQKLILLRGHANPLKLIADEITQQYCLICFDEFFVSNVADAMILANLFDELFTKKIILIATSNIDAKNLYQNGLNRDRFLVTIEHIYRHCDVLEIANQCDYRRLKAIEQNMSYYCFPLNAESEQWLMAQYLTLTDQAPIVAGEIVVQHRCIKVKAADQHVVWFDFATICRDARSPADYIEIASRYDYVLISAVEALTDQIYDVVRRFIYLIDELYAQKIGLYFSSDQALAQLYLGERLAFEFQRTYSRLHEMQTISYSHSAQSLLSKNKTNRQT